MILAVITFIFMFLIVAFCNFRIFSPIINSNTTVSRYLYLSKKYQTDDPVVAIVRIIAILFNISFFILLMATMERDDEFLRSLNLNHLVLYYLIEVSLHTFIFAKEIKQRIDLLSYLKANITSLVNILIVLITIFYSAKSSYLSQVIQAQNQINFFYINWNSVVLFPLFIIFALQYVTFIKDLMAIKKVSEIDMLHNAVYFLTKTLVFVCIVIVLFLGADTSFAILDNMDLNSIQILILNKIIFLVKFVAISFGISFLLKNKRWENVLARVKSNKVYLYINAVFVLLLLGYGVVN